MMINWICSVPLSALCHGLQKIEVGRSPDPRSALHGVHFHALHSRGSRNSSIHLIGSDGPERGAICHVDATVLQGDSSYRCVLPGEFQDRIEAELDPDEVLQLGTQKDGEEFVVLGTKTSSQLVFRVRQGWGRQGLACFPDSSFTIVEANTYWVKGGVEPLVQTIQEVTTLEAKVLKSDIFDEDDFDEYDEQLGNVEPVKIAVSAPPAVLQPPATVVPKVPMASRLSNIDQSMPVAPPLRVQNSQRIRRVKTNAAEPVKQYEKPAQQR